MDNFHKINFEVSFKKGYAHPNLLNVQMILKNYFNRAFLIDVLTINFPKNNSTASTKTNCRGVTKSYARYVMLWNL